MLEDVKEDVTPVEEDVIPEDDDDDDTLLLEVLEENEEGIASHAFTTRLSTAISSVLLVMIANLTA